MDTPLAAKIVHSPNLCSYSCSLFGYIYSSSYPGLSVGTAMNNSLSDIFSVLVRKSRPSINILFILTFFFGLWDTPLQLWDIADRYSTRSLCRHKFSSVFMAKFRTVHHMLPKFIQQWFLWSHTSMRKQCSANRMDFSRQYPSQIIVFLTFALVPNGRSLPSFICCPSRCTRNHEVMHCQWPSFPLLKWLIPRPVLR